MKAQRCESCGRFACNSLEEIEVLCENDKSSSV